MALPVGTEHAQNTLREAFSKDHEEFARESIDILRRDNPILLGIVTAHVSSGFSSSDKEESMRKKHSAMKVFLVFYRILLESGNSLPFASVETCKRVIDEWNSSGTECHVEYFSRMVTHNLYLAQFSTSLVEGLFKENSDRSTAIGSVILCYRLLEAQDEADSKAWVAS